MEGLLNLQSVHTELPVSRKPGNSIFGQELVQMYTRVQHNVTLS